jgi:hypothetical protein
MTDEQHLEQASPTKPKGERVELVTETERLAYTSGASTFYYRRLTMPVRNRLMHKATKRGNTDWGEFQALAMKWCLLGWDGVNMAGAPVPFEADLIGAIPQDVIGELQDLTGAKAVEDEERLGN